MRLKTHALIWSGLFLLGVFPDLAVAIALSGNAFLFVMLLKEILLPPMPTVQAAHPPQRFSQLIHELDFIEKTLPETVTLSRAIEVYIHSESGTTDLQHYLHSAGLDLGPGMLLITDIGYSEIGPRILKEISTRSMEPGLWIMRGYAQGADLMVIPRLILQQNTDMLNGLIESLSAWNLKWLLHTETAQLLRQGDYTVIERVGDVNEIRVTGDGHRVVEPAELSAGHS